MHFSIASVDVDWSFVALSLVLLVVYVLLTVVAGRRFGLRGLWAAWIVAVVATSLFPLVIHGAHFAHLDAVTMVLHTAVVAVPMAISAWVIASTLRRPRPVGVPVQLALGTVSFVLAFLVVAAAVFVVLFTH
ncbi:MAG TPA: hypothetical protein VF584_14395 [Longimicrobium sp.]|jgi:hypothetical protein